jgi:hypothetical protein
MKTSELSMLKRLKDKDQECQNLHAIHLLPKVQKVNMESSLSQSPKVGDSQRLPWEVMEILTFFCIAHREAAVHICPYILLQP